MSEEQDKDRGKGRDSVKPLQREAEAYAQGLDNLAAALKKRNKEALRGHEKDKQRGRRKVQAVVDGILRGNE